MITKRRILSRIEILEFGHIQIQEQTILEEDGVELSRLNHRRVLTPGRNDPDRETDKRLREVLRVVWTPEVVDYAKKNFPRDVTKDKH
jgi:hypothetical protein